MLAVVSFFGHTDFNLFPTIASGAVLSYNVPRPVMSGFSATHPQIEQVAHEAGCVPIDLVEFAFLHQDQRIGALKLYSGKLDQHIAGLNPRFEIAQDMSAAWHTKSQIRKDLAPVIVLQSSYLLYPTSFCPGARTPSDQTDSVA
jgi:hypothetical protein